MDDPAPPATPDGRPPFRRALYDPEIRAAYADNAADPYLFAELRRNAHVKVPTYRALVIGTQAITQHLLSVAVLVGVFLHLHSGAQGARGLGPDARRTAQPFDAAVEHGCRDGDRLGDLGGARPESAVTAVVRGSIVGVARTRARPPQPDTQDARARYDERLDHQPDLRALRPQCAAGRLSRAETDGQEPWRVRTTKHESTDLRRLPGALSLNAAISASTVLASRLSKPRDAHARVFALLLFSFVWFALAPALRKDLRVRLPRH